MARAEHIRRASCKRPADEPCVAGSRGPCRACADLSKSSARMKALNADPEFAARNSARMKALHADPEFAATHSARSSARMKALHADPEFAARNSARMKALNAKRMAWCPEHLRNDYRLLARALGATEARAIIERQLAEAAE